MKPSHLLPVALAVLASSLSVAGCAAEEQEGAGAQFPAMPESEPTAVAPSSGPGETPIPIEVQSQPVAAVEPPAPPPPPPQPQRMVPGETTEEEYNARPRDPAESAGQDEYADQDPSALTDFRGALDPYGSWVEDPNYGTVWTPDPNVVGSDFAPYVSAGRWTYDDYQSWTWVSDYDWGWAPFHYGRWAYLGTRWGWVPGRQYAGAWVSWRTGYDGYDYLGWAPIAPTYGWRYGAAFGLGFAPGLPWVFCGSHEIFSPGLGSHLVRGQQVAAVGQHSRVYSSPSVSAGAGRVAAHPTVGPAPPSVGIRPNEVMHTPPTNRGVLHAQQYARPSTAQAMGAHAALASSEHYTSRNGLGAIGYRNEPVARAPQYAGIAPGQHYFPSHSIGSIYNVGPRYGSGYSAHGGYSSPSYGGGAHYGPSYGAGGGAYGSYGGYRGGTIHGVNGGNSSSSSSQGGDHEETPFHGGGSSRGGGGFRGGGGRGGGGGGSHGGGGHR